MHRTAAAAPSTPLTAFAVGVILLAEGYASLTTEILALRRMVPFAGSAVSVTAVLLAVYLAALAAGYRRGGRLARTGNLRSRLALRLAGAGLWAAVWLSGIGTTLVFSLPGPPLLQVAVYALVGIAPVGWLLAESVLLAHACAPPSEASRRAGGVFALSTLGNVAGALLTTFLLLRFLGIAAAILVLVGLLCLAAILAERRRVFVLSMLAATLYPLHDLWLELTVYVERNAYADYRIVEFGDGARVLDVSGSGMTLGRGAPCPLEVTFVDIDPAQRRIAARFLGEPDPAQGRFVARDARAFLRSDAADRAPSGGWPAIVVDTYSNPRTLPQHLLTVEFYRLARSRLADGGSLYVNHLSWPDDTRFRTRAERTLRSVFADCSQWPVGLEQGQGWHAVTTTAGNLLFRCRHSALDGDTAIYSDAVPRADLDRSLR